MLEPSFPEKLPVEEINYRTREIRVQYYKDSCLTRQALILSLAASPFKLRDEGLDVEYYTFIFFVAPQFIG